MGKITNIIFTENTNTYLTTDSHNKHDITTNLNRINNITLDTAKAFGEKADIAQNTLKELGPKFVKTVEVLINRNRELGMLVKHVIHSDVTSLPNGAYFWSGHTLNSSREKIYCAMLTAQHMAKNSQGDTVETTKGGRELENYYAGGFLSIKKRFNYLDRRHSQDLMTSMVKKQDKCVSKEVIDMLTNSDSPNAVATNLWDILSVRFSEQVVGVVNVIHAAESTDPYFQSDEYKYKCTWMTKERPILIKKHNVVIKEYFAEDLQGKLKGPKP